MSGLASLLLGLGHRVSGSDKATNQETRRLQEAGLEFFCPHTVESVSGAALVIYSSAIKKGNVAYDAALAGGIPCVRRAEALAAILREKKGIVVAGTHGKTTTSSMAAYVLRSGGLNPSHYVGAEVPVLGVNAHWDPEGSYMVAEGDESDGTLVNFHPEHSVILNIEAEHLDHYGGLDEIKAVFRKLLDQTSGMVVYCGSDPGAKDVCGEWANAVSYGWEEWNDYSAAELETIGQSSAFSVIRKSVVLGKMVLNIPGRHNILNALAVIALATELGVSFDRIRAALESFRGARRRFEVKYHTDRFMVIDDYGHHPTEIRATIETAAELGRRLLVAFQPHRYSRTQLLRAEFGSAFERASELIVSDVYPASELPIEGVSGETIVDAVKENGMGPLKVSCGGAVQGLHLLVGNALREGDAILTLGAGNINEVAGRLVKDLGVVERILDTLDEENAVVRLYEPMSKHTTIRIGGPADYWIEPVTIEGFARVVRLLREMAIPVRVVGRGSNLLVLDGGIRGAVIHPAKGEFQEVHIEGELLTAGAGARFKKVTSFARNSGLGGFEWMEGIPGNVGGGLRMNAGAMGLQTFDQLVSVRLLDLNGNIKEKLAEEIESFYRNVPELEDNFVVSATFRGSPSAIEDIDKTIEQSKGKRRKSQPVAASAGCIFKNPQECPAGQLIEQLGLKNHSIGAARVSDVHGNFIVNDGGATAASVVELIHSVQQAARAERGIELETEVQVLGESLADIP
ncbi:MAG: UDP-N-acetylmuramate--L-alanine ligase [Verrucomicrobiae bacterium]|nr:UDP-N-acetylmuramate--L-alanine ligase [Verrucomicrobiae bacterium]